MCFDGSRSLTLCKRQGALSQWYLIFKPQIRPKAIQGVLVRESGIAVGMYDPTYLQYPYNEGQKFNQLTGEIYATGLSVRSTLIGTALMRHNDRYLELSEWLHRKLRTKVFPKIKQMTVAPAAKRRKENQAFLRQQLVKWPSRSTSTNLFTCDHWVWTSLSFQ